MNKERMLGDPTGRRPARAMTLEQLAKIEAACDHVWVEEYYGTGCTQCGAFYPHGCAPWDIDDDT